MRVLHVCLLVLLLGVSLVSCDSRTLVERATEEKLLIVGNSNEPKGLDPHMVSGVLESNLLRALFEGLAVNHPSKDGHAEKGAGGAIDWKANEDFTVWTFHLNPEGKWSDGVPVTAQDYVFSYERMLDPDLPAKYADMLFYIKNAEVVNKDQRSFVLLHKEAELPIEAKELRESPFVHHDKTDTKDLADKAFGDLSDEEKKRLLKGRGLDALGPEHLKFVAVNRDFIDWPEKFDAPWQTRLLAKLEDYYQKHQEGKYDSLNDLLPIGAKAIDDFTLEITLRGPIPFLPELTKHYTWFPVPRHVILKWGKKDKPFTDWTKPGNMVSNGPFQLKTWRVTHYIEVERNPHYWDAKNVKLNGIRFMPITSGYTEVRMFMDGLLHMTYTCPAEMIPYGRKKIPHMLRQEAYVGTRFIRCNIRVKPLEDPRVTHALAAALDRQSLIDNILQGGQQPAYGITPPFGTYETPNVVSFDVEKAKRLLTEAGYPNGEGFPELKFLTTDRDVSRRMAEAYQAMWKENLGINVRIEQREWTTYLQRQYDGEYELCAGGWIGDYLDPTTFLDMWTDGNGNNNTGWASDEFEGALKRAENTADAAERFKILIEAEKILLQDLPVLPVFWYTTNYLIRPEVKNWNPLLLNNHPFKYVDLVPVPKDKK